MIDSRAIHRVLSSADETAKCLAWVNDNLDAYVSQVKANPVFDESRWPVEKEARRLATRTYLMEMSKA